MASLYQPQVSGLSMLKSIWQCICAAALLAALLREIFSPPHHSLSLVRALLHRQQGRMAHPPSSHATATGLTTIFTPPSSCLQRTYTLSPSGLDTTGAPPGGYLSIWRGYTLDCYPPEAILNDGYVYLSPGICPSAYSIAIQYTNPNPVGPTTVATCCPWFMHASASHYDCASYPESTSVELIENGTTITTSGYAWDTPLVIAWQETDLSLFPHHPTATGSWNVAKGIASPASPTTVPPITVTSGGMFISAQPSDGGIVSGKNLSTGAQAGIGVGVSLAVILAVAVGVFVLLRRRRMKKMSAPSGGNDIDPESPDTVKAAAQLEGDAIYEKAATEGVLEAGGQPLGHELTGSRAYETLHRAELEGSSPPELEGDSGYLIGVEGRGELEVDLKTNVLEDVGRRELEGDFKEPPDYESPRDYSRDIAKVDHPYTPDVQEMSDEKTKEDINAKE